MASWWDEIKAAATGALEVAKEEAVAAAAGIFKDGESSANQSAMPDAVPVVGVGEDGRGGGRFEIPVQAGSVPTGQIMTVPSWLLPVSAVALVALILVRGR